MMFSYKYVKNIKFLLFFCCSKLNCHILSVTPLKCSALAACVRMQLAEISHENQLSHLLSLQFATPQATAIYDHSLQNNHLLPHQLCVDSDLPFKTPSFVLLGTLVLAIRQSEHMYMYMGQKLRRVSTKLKMMVTFAVR